MRRALVGIPVLAVLAFSLYYGVPYVKDNNETFHSYMHGWNLVHDGARHSFLTVSGVRGLACPYTHNPNFPRYVHALLLTVTDDLVVHVAVISAAAMALTGVFVTRLFAPGHAGLILAGTLLDWVGAQYLANTYRAWSFVLFWGCLLAVRHAWAAFGAFFVLFQFEYGFAVFVAVTALIVARTWRVRWYALTGAAASLLAYAVQVVSYLGIEGTLSELALTVDRRVMTPGVWEWPSHYRWSVVAVAVMALACIRPDGLGRIYGAMVAGGAVATLLLSGYVRDAFFLHGLPFLTFFTVVAFALVGSRMRYTTPLLAVLLLINSFAYWQTFPPVPRGYIEAIRAAPGPVYSAGPIYGLAFAVDPRPGPVTQLLCLHRPWLGLTCERPFTITPGRPAFTEAPVCQEGGLRNVSMPVPHSGELAWAGG